MTPARLAAIECQARAAVHSRYAGSVLELAAEVRRLQAAVERERRRARLLRALAQIYQARLAGAPQRRAA